MAEPNALVFARVREEIARRPDIPPGVLFQMAQAIDPAIAEQTVQQFHIRYVLPALQEVKTPPKRRQRRRRSDAKQPRRRTGRSRSAARTGPGVPPLSEGKVEREEAKKPGELGTPDGPESRRPARQPAERAAARDRRDQVRAVFLRFAMGLARADTPGEIVEIIQRVDGYVAEVYERPR